MNIARYIASSETIVVRIKRMLSKGMSNNWREKAAINKNVCITREPGVPIQLVILVDFFSSQLFISIKLFWCPREESNSYFILRTDLFYPLNYEGDISLVSIH